MRMARNAILSAFLATGLLVAGCSSSGTANQAEDAQQLEAAFVQGKALNASFTDARLAEMKGIAENERLRLFINEETGAIAVLNKSGGEVWHSNPLEAEADPIATGVNKGLLSSQLKIDYYNGFGQVNSINTYLDSVAYEQVKYEAMGSGVKVTYKFGKAERSAMDLPLMLSVARFEELTGKLDKAGQRALRIGYTNKEDQAVYARNDQALNGLQLDRAFKAFEDAGYTQEDLEKDMAELNFSQDSPAARVFLASIEYKLDADSLVVKVPSQEIQSPGEYPVSNVSMLSFFGAAGSEEKGSIFVPDGSGALIAFNNGKTKYPAYQQAVYGNDQAMERVENAVNEQTVRLPVFGMIRDGNAFIGIIEEGASVATINADISGKLNSYNYVYPTFNVTNKGELTLQANGSERTLPKFQEHPMKSDFTVRYAFLTGESATYQGMAEYYRQYLESQGGLPMSQKGSGESELPFYVQVVGSIEKQKHFVGVPYKTLEPLTTFKQTQEMINEMKQLGIANIKLRYAGWFNGGLDHKVPDDLSVDRAIGGAKGLRSLALFAEEQGVDLYPDVAILTAHTGKGFDEKEEASRSLRGVPSSFYPLDLALGRRDRSKSPSYVVSPRRVGTYVDAILKDMEGFKTSGISLRDMADKLNSDFRKNKQIDRTESEDISTQALNSIREANLNILAEGGNAYALPYLSDITNAPLTNSRYKLEDQEIPFFQMVIRGNIDYTGSPYNLTSYTNVRQYILKCLEYGSGVYFEWIHEPNYKVKDTEFSNLYAVHYEQWLEQAASIYAEVNGVLSKVQNERIVGHEKLAEGLFKTVYENGTYVIVNYNATHATVNGMTIEAEGYVTGGEQS
jgi:outer membrane murein-binding lipoprotein Lpp